MTERDGLRERKKAATREALSAAALRLALERGPENVRVDDIAEAAGVSPRTYNNYFSSREQAIVAAIASERALRIGAALRARPADEPLAEAVVEAVVEQHTEPSGDALTLITSAPALRAEFIETVASIESPLAAAIAERLGRDEGLATAVLAAAVTAAARVAVEQWVGGWQPAAGDLLVVPQGPPLADLLRDALALVVPALQAI
ncbi:TetR/AcrR family transcriptional regulator [Amycolatopsis sp. YIM 10]|uniref:TetR/AcrR family transcriptional regulator n=1 Tax=Amycolatopsis sp. YIM 10 TaxID=2653857 RepID=UPI0012A9CAAF|nr:TetR/AcrR family transcriptional regulator [Amycolatopsis sp. YIM 10]QFU93415.1 HTH-type transcriptional regulator BetI [Amycolatopsis sp. YIM 10]